MIVLNGHPAPDMPVGITVAELVRRVAGVDPDGRGVAVALDATVVPRGSWATTTVPDGARVEVVGAVQGG
ncbi:sulfur carrier protein ThiS [Paraconexibacter sp.]|uniref:sulfur carrier protein ThiS n=1 Tax=Paraconexibacter sp. TaxID=2949640 RepID=UPI0035669CA2